MDSRLEGRIAIITGGSSGLGRATALKFAKSGARVVVADLASTGVETGITSECGANAAIFVKVDVTQESEIQALVTEATSFGSGRIDILCNYAGIGIEGKHEPAKKLHEFPVDDFDKTWSINVRGTWLCNKYVVAQMLKQEPSSPNARGERTRGRILNVASILGLVASAALPAYVPSKHAVVGMTKQMAASYAKDRIHVNCLCPGYTHTPIISKVYEDPAREQAITSLHPWGALGEPEDMADAALYLCSDEARWVTGTTMTVDGGYTAV